MSRKIGIGVIGAGVFGGHHAGKYAAHKNAALIGVFDANPSAADALANRHGAKSFTDYESLLERIDAAVIATPASHHFALAQRALEKGCHLFVEKPMTLTVSEADTLIKLAEKNNLTLQIGHQERYVFLAAGLLDRKCAPTKIDSVRCAAPSGRCEDVSVVFDLMVHDLDLIRQLTGADIKTVAASGDRNEATADLTLSNETIVSLKASRCSAALDRRMTLVYPDGVIEFDFVKRKIANSTPAKLEVNFSDTIIPLAFSDPLAFGADQFIAAILNGAQPIVTAEHGRKAVGWAMEIEAAASISADNKVDTAERLRA